jgi:serine/threonine protein kinase
MESRLTRAVKDERKLWHVGSNDRKFIPHHRVDEILTDDAVIDVLREYELEPWVFDRTKNKVLDGGKKTFAILLLLGEGRRICAFVEQEQYSNAGLDAKLPLELSAAEAYVGDRADDFVLYQWELIAPIFSKDGPHLQKPGTILPFLSERRLNDREGSFGTIHEVRMPSSHVPLLLQPAQDVSSRSLHSLTSLLMMRKIITLIRKDVESKSQVTDLAKETDTAEENVTASKAALRAEMDMLKYLNDLKHPNIVQLLGSYSKGTTHSFLFPQKACNLGDILAGHESTPVLAEDRIAFQALGQLASALHSLHNFTSNLFQVEFIGCHRDIKPDNILVDDGGFYLADFGLSVFHSKADGSSTSYNHGGGLYRAPECQQGPTFENGRVNRASDIWSFGCILAEILTYLTKGADGVEKFKVRRTFPLYPWYTTQMFHAGDKEHPEVEPWLRSLPISPDCAKAGLLVLVLEMLNMDPLQRPSAGDVTLRLRSLSIQCQIEGIVSRLNTICAFAQDLELDIERERLSTVLKATCMDRTQEDSLSVDLRRALKAIFSTESGVQNAFRNFDALGLESSEYHPGEVVISAQALRPLRFHLRVAVESLIGAVSESTRKEMQNLLEIKFLSTEDRDILKRYSNIGEEHPVLSRLAAAKLMSISLSSSTGENATNLRYNVSALSNPRRVGHIELADFQGATVIVERRAIEASWTDEFGRRLLRRVIRLAEELAKPPIPEFRTLQCVGFCADMETLSYNLFFRLPGTGPDTSLQTMASALGHRTGKPRLEHRFHLALNLARSIAQFHKASWLHKNINSSSVVFFHPTDGSSSDNGSSVQPPVDYRFPLIVGFNYSRPEDESKWSEGLISDLSLLDYHHPDYAQHRRGFCIEDDYYSLGIVLLEIGLWKTLAKSIAKLEADKKIAKRASPDVLKKAILVELVPQLGVQMGSAYEQTVRCCLEGINKESRGADSASSGSTVALMEFTEKVVKRLQVCTSVVGSASEY